MFYYRDPYLPIADSKPAVGTECTVYRFGYYSNGWGSIQMIHDEAFVTISDDADCSTFQHFNSTEHICAFDASGAGNLCPVSHNKT